MCKAVQESFQKKLMNLLREERNKFNNKNKNYQQSIYNMRVWLYKFKISLETILRRYK